MGVKTSSSDIVPTTTPSPVFIHQGKPFCFVGANNYYLMYKERSAVLDVLDAALALNVRVLRIWAFLDRGSLDGTVPNSKDPGHQDGVYFQYWDMVQGAPAENDGPDGLERLDFVLSEARKRHLLLTLVLTNNWRDFGGMDQYLTWYGLKEHHAFYVDERVRTAYKRYAEHLIGRTNSIDGVVYRDDPTIFSWELANEPRAINYGSFDRATGWDEETIVRWADEMSSFIKSIDPNHMVAVGDEGFLRGGGRDWPYQAPFGVDHEQLIRLNGVDYGTYHLYPDHWGTTPQWGNNWIRAHIAVGRRAGKPNVLEEYGMPVRRRDGIAGPVVEFGSRRRAAYTDWNDLVLHEGGQAALFWMLSGFERPGSLYPDYDHFAVYRGDASSVLLGEYAARFGVEAASCRLAQDAHTGQLRSPFVSASRGVSPGVSPMTPPVP